MDKVRSIDKARTSLIKKNIFYSFLIKGWSGLVQLLIVPVTLFCLGNYENGIWMTISSILVWIDSLDIGLGNGLRNKLAEYIAVGDRQKARESVSTTFFMLILIIIPIAVIAIIAICNGNPYRWLNVVPTIVGDLRQALVIAVAFICSTFIFKFIGNVYLSLQLPAINNAIVVSGQTLSLVFMVALKMLNIHSLELTALAYTLSPLIVYLIAYPITFYKRYPYLRPSLRCFKKDMVKELLTVGVQFFFLQIAGVVIFASSNVIISKQFSPSFVTPYQVAYRYFSVAVMVFTVIASPFWSATTDAYNRNDYEWIRQSIKKLHKTLLLIVIGVIIMVIASAQIYSVWVGSSVHIDYSTSTLMAIYSIIIMYSVSYSYFLNGMGILRLQLIMTILAAVCFFPLSTFLSQPFGINGIIIALILVNIPGAITNTVQFNKEIRTFYKYGTKRS